MRPLAVAIQVDRRLLGGVVGDELAPLQRLDRAGERAHGGRALLEADLGLLGSPAVGVHAAVVADGDRRRLRSGAVGQAHVHHDEVGAIPRRIVERVLEARHGTKRGGQRKIGCFVDHRSEVILELPIVFD